jgi:hypothetical protein
MPYEGPYAPSLWPQGATRIGALAGLWVAPERSWVCLDSWGRVERRMTLTPLLTPLRAQHSETAGNHQQRNLFR